MIAKMSATAALYGALAYNQTKVEGNSAKVLLTNRMIEPRDGRVGIAACLRSFEPYLAANRNTEKPVLHLSLNPDPADRLTDNQFVEIAVRYMERMGYGDQPYIVYKHEDIERRHIHIVSLRVDETGRKIDSRFENRRSMAVCRELEREFGLVRADGKQRQDVAPPKPIRYDDGDVKHGVAGVIRLTASSWHFQSLGEYRTLLSLYNVGVEEVRGEVRGKPYRGLVYSALNDRGEKVGTPFPASRFGKSAGVEALERRMAKSALAIRERGLRERSRAVIAEAMRTAGCRANFERALGRQGVSVLLRTGGEGRIYGATFIDHRQMCVFNGSRLGKEFSANVLNERFNVRASAGASEGYSLSVDPLDYPSREADTLDTGIAGLVGLLPFDGGSDAADEFEERALTRRMKKRRKRGM